MCNVYLSVYLSVCLPVCNRHNIFFCFEGTYDKYHVVNTVQSQAHIILTKIINIIDTISLYISGCQGLVIVNL